MVTTSLFLGMRLYLKVLYGECGSNGASEYLYCNSNASTHGLPEDSFFAALIFPITYSTLLRDTDVSVMVSSWVITVVFMLLSVTREIESLAPCMTIVFYILASSITLYSNQKQNIRSFVVQQQLATVIKQNEEMTEELRANELRHMVGNVAHDLKTVSIIILLIFTSSYGNSMYACCSH
jgi:signal transduction histidine kinase